MISEINEDPSEEKIKLYKKRWFILGFLALLTFSADLNYSAFIMVNNLMVAYFNKPYAITDWMVLASNLGIVLTSPILAWFTYNDQISCRKVMICASAMIMLSCACSIAAFIDPQLFGLLVFGQIGNGIAFTSSFTLPPVLAQLWFPESEIGVAIGLSFLGLSLQGTISFIMIPSVLELNKLTNVSFESLSNITRAAKTTTATISNEAWKENVKFVYEILFSIIFLYTLAEVLLLWIWVPEQPTKPPSYAQYLKRCSNANTNPNQQEQGKKTLRTFALETGSILSDKVVLFSSLSVGIACFIVYLDLVLLQEILTEFNICSFSSLSASIKAGIIGMSYCIGSATSNYFTGILLDRFKNYYFLSCIGATASLLCAVGAVLSLNFHQGILFTVLFFAFGFSNRMFAVSQTDLMMQHIYPKNILFTSSWMTFIYNVVSIISITIGRQVYHFFSGIWAMFYVCVLMLIVLIVSVSIRPKLNRLSVEESHSSNRFSESTFLLAD